MGFLSKHNPQATPESARRAAIRSGVLYGLIASGVWYLGWRRGDLPLGLGCVLIPWMVAVGAVVGWAFEWQLPKEE